MENVLERQLLKAGNILEQEVDKEIKRLDELASNEDDLEMFRQRRLQALKEEAAKKEEWRSNGHGIYSEVGDEKDFFQACKKSKWVVCHFFRPTTQRCQIVDKHLESLAVRHLETRFIKINVERCLFLAERLRIVVLPTIALIIDDKVADYIVGFDDLGGKDDFSTSAMESRLARGRVINYSGDLSKSLDNPKRSTNITKHRNLRSQKNDSDDSD